MVVDMIEDSTVCLVPSSCDAISGLHSSHLDIAVLAEVEHGEAAQVAHAVLVRGEVAEEAHNLGGVCGHDEPQDERCENDTGRLVEEEDGFVLEQVPKLIAHLWGGQCGRVTAL